MKKIMIDWLNAATKVIFWITMSALVGAGLSYGAMLGLNVYAALHGA